MGLVIHFLVVAAAMMLMSRAHWPPGFEVDGWGPAIVAALVLGIVNTIVRPILILLTLPLTIVTLGLFLFVINVLMLFLTAAIVPGFHLHGFLSALAASLILAIAGMVARQLAKGV